MHQQQVTFQLRESGAYAICSHNEATGKAAFIQHDGRHAMRVVGLTKAGFEESVTRRRVVPGGVAITTSTLRGDRNHQLEWHWTVNRPGLHRTEVWKISSGTRGTWKQVDVRPGRTTTYHVAGPGRYEGKVVGSDGELLWISHWQSDGNGGTKGQYFSPSGETVGNVHFSSDRESGEDSRITWEGPESSGSITPSESGSGAVMAIVQGSGLDKTYQWVQPDGHVLESGSATEAGVNRSWTKDTVPGKDGSSTWVETGTETGGGQKSSYTIAGTQHADGSTEFSRESVDANGDHEVTFGGRDNDGNSSTSSRVEHPDGSVTLITRTVDKQGNGTEQVTTVDPSGNVLDDHTNNVGAGSTGNPGPPTGGSSGAGPSPSPDPEPDPAPEPDPDTDPNDPEQPDQPDSPDNGGDKGGGRPSDDGSGGGGDEAPRRPWEGHRQGDKFADFFSGIRGGEEDEGAGASDGLGFGIDEWINELDSELHHVSGGADETGWGGGEGPRGRTLMTGSLSVPHPSADESGWGDITDPRALIAYVGTLAGVASHLAGSANLVRGK